MTPDEVLATYENLINRHDFDLLVPLIAEDATFWFSEGSYSGPEEIRAAFERTWALLTDETYWLDERRWIVRGDDVAVCSYRFIWRATVEGKPQSGGGRGTSVLRSSNSIWTIAHEHLSA